jgi:hypothetical protein
MKPTIPITEWLGAEEEFSRAFQEKISEEQEKNGNNPSTWKHSGRRSAKYPDKEGRGYWDENGPGHIERWIAWRDANPHHSIWEAPDGQLGIELNLMVMFGGVKVKTIIDRVMNVGNELAIVDVKSGAHKPSSLLQLGVYACAVEIEYGVRPGLGTYYMTRKGEVTGFESLDHLSIPFVTHLFESFAERANAGKYLPMPGDHCVFCDGRNACALMNGRDARSHDVLSILK